MKGLLLKEFYMAKKYCRMYVLIAVIFIATSAAGGSLFMQWYPMILAGIIPMSLIAYDENSRWTAYAEAFPYTRKQIVGAKYMITLMCIVIAVIFVGVAEAINMVRTGGGIDAQKILAGMCMPLAIGALLPGLMLPAVFKLGVEKGRVVYYLTVILTCALLAGVGAVTELDATQIAVVLGNWSALLILAFGILLFAASWMLSVKFYEGREL